MRSETLPLLALVQGALAVLSGKVGPSTSREAKTAVKICDIVNFNGVQLASSDISPSILRAWEACKAGGTVKIPNGSFSLAKPITLTGGKGVAIDMEGVIVRNAEIAAGDTMITVQASDDFEFYSSNSEGGIQGNGYELHGGEFVSEISYFLFKVSYTNRVARENRGKIWVGFGSQEIM
jgi:rhamnogalacturonan hydrolase